MRLELEASLNKDMLEPQIGVLNPTPHKPVSSTEFFRRDRRRFRLISLIAAAMLLSVVFFVYPHHPNSTSGGSSAPALTLSPSVVDVAKSEQQVTVHIMNFPASHHVQLSHDIQEAVRTVGGSSRVTIMKYGSVEATLIVNDNWAVGFDQVYAEDTTTHYIASAQLQVIGNAPSKPAHLELLDQHGKALTSLDFGSAIQGSNTILPLTLENSGSGSITWSASSNQPWLLVAPGQGTFSQSQKIDVAAQSSSLKPGKFTGALTLSSNVSAQPQTIQVTMTVIAPPVPGPVLSPTPAVLSFTTTDGSAAAPQSQPLILNNPGTQALNWSLTIPASTSPSNQVALAHMPGISSNWLSADQTSGTVLAGSSQQILVSVNSTSLLPGTYLEDLVFSAPGAVDGSSQRVAVSLTVQPHCGLVTNSGSLSFTAVQGKPNPSNQSLGLNATASCAGAPISWKAALSSSSNWLSATPSSGTLTGTTSEFLSVGANAARLPVSARPYYGFLAFTTPTSTQTVMVALTVQPPPAPGAPVMSAAPLNLNFSNTYGQPNPGSQVVTITNTGQSPLNWSTNVNLFASTWLGASPTGGSVPPGQTGQLVVTVDISHLSPGSYAGQITLNGLAPASGSGQVVSINLVVQPPCTLTQPSSSSLAFSGAQGPYNPISQTLLITGTGNCAWPLALTASVPTNAPWLVVQPASNSIKANGQSSSFTVQPISAGNLLAGVYTTSITLSATNSAGTVATGSPQAISVTVTVLPPCVPVVAPTPTLAFTVAQGQTSPAPKSILLKETGTCSRPVTWTAMGDGSSGAWLSFSSPPQDTGSGSPLKVTVTSTGLAAGTYTGTISVSATDSNGNNVGTPRTLKVTLTVTPTYSVSGSVVACTGVPTVCLTPVALQGATLTLFDSANKQVASSMADGSGTYTFTNLSPGSYTITVTGTLNSVMYSATGIPLVVTGPVTGFTLNTW
jgi:Viral BACON domain/Carboxypeptidase regulatory-like domain